ncbi:MAG: GntR family transcriptional regulator [Fluviibacter sp.]
MGATSPKAAKIRSPRSSQPIVSSALYQEVADRLREEIFDHVLQPGEWIDELALVARYGISRTPLREALKVLAAEGLVTLKPRRGSYVAEISKEDAAEIYPVLAMLEGRCAYEATRRLSDVAASQLQSCHDALEQAAAAGEIRQFFEVNQEFHRLVQEQAANRWLIQIINDLRKVLKLSRLNSLSRVGRLGSSLAEHRLILAAMLDRDAEGAEAAMRAHLLAGQHAIQKQMDEGAPRERNNT